MLERIMSLLAGLGTPAQLQAVAEAVTLLSDNGFHQCDQMLQDEIAMCADEPTKLIGNLTELRLIPLFRDFLESMGIALVPGLPLSQVCEIFDATIRIENFEDQDLIYSLATSEEDSVETYLAILSVVGTKPEEYFAPMIENVSDHVIARIAEVVGDFTPPPVVDQAAYYRAKGRVLKCVEVFKIDYADVYAEYVKLDALRLGCPADLLMVDIHDNHDSIPELVAVVLIVLYVASSDVPDSELSKRVHAEISQTFTELVPAMSASKAAVRLLAKVGYA